MTPRYRFHCTDGLNVEIDGVGTPVTNEAQVRVGAERTARAVMDRYGLWLDWSDWIVDVHDAKGRRVLTLTFEEAGDQRRAA